MGLNFLRTAIDRIYTGRSQRYQAGVKWGLLVLVVLVLIVICVLFLQSVLNPDPRDEIIGRWRTADGETSVEFFEDDTGLLDLGEISLELQYEFIDDSQVRIFTQTDEQVWQYAATSETVAIISPNFSFKKTNVVIDWRFARRIVPDMLKGLEVTVRATLIAFLLALLFGFIFALARRSPNRLVSFPAAAIVEFTRSTPLLVQLFFFFFVLPRYGVKLPAFQIGVVALGLHYGTYCSEVYRAGIDGVEKGQWEAATALNIDPRRKWLAIILPQAMPPMIPAFGNYLVAMFKETAQLTVLAIVELLTTAQTIGAQDFRYLEPITMAGFMYFAVSFPASLIVQRLEQRFGRKR